MNFRESNIFRFLKVCCSTLTIFAFVDKIRLLSNVHSEFRNEPIEIKSIEDSIGQEAEQLETVYINFNIALQLWMLYFHRDYVA